MSKLKIGDDVVCVDSDAYLNITKGNTYSVLDVWQTKIYIKNDNGSKVWYPKKLFIKAEQVNKEKFIPKVGEDCLWLSHNTGVYHHTKIIHIFEESAWLEGEGIVAHEPNRYKPLKTTAEIEQDRIINKALNTLGHSRGDFTIVSILKQLYRANLLSDKHSKPLSYEEFDGLYISTDYRPSLYKKLKPYTIQGGE